MGDEDSWKRWRRLREEGLAAEHGWLTVTSYQWLPESPGPLEGLPGLWSAGPAGPGDGKYDAGIPVARLTAAAADGLVDGDGPGAPVVGTLVRAVGEGESVHWVRHGSTLVELGLRGGRYMVRTRERDSAARAAFRGIPTFAYAPEWVLRGRFEPYPTEREVDVASFRADTRLTVLLAGEVVFESGGREYRLAAAEAANGGLTVAFHDTTNGVDTPAWRFLPLQPPAPDPAGGWSVDLDFNRALDYPFAFTGYAVCPAPPEGNRLDFAVTAGEKSPQQPLP
ncbi:hypothetical protein NCCP1664_13130 [Zafaria cholistanensis]|uniref:DUF1684 domain-containing protein n=1 Tax=Zafaria cholistanensis TaxID=1682741 RepID=A0A5A7NQJ9_9MICC|nr:DUF1684 domain-containing protein [Zafaria cholistanensis]GER22816.1 hypothetical protein NCCP1664_13130 [Zafaria cholistanensis]